MLMNNQLKLWASSLVFHTLSTKSATPLGHRCTRVWLMTTPVLHGDWCLWRLIDHIDGLVQERRNSIANALELRLYCTNPLICNKFVSWEWLLFFLLVHYCSWCFYFSVKVELSVGWIHCELILSPFPMVYQHGLGVVVYSLFELKTALNPTK